MSGVVHVRFCGCFGGRAPRANRPGLCHTPLPLLFGECTAQDCGAFYVYSPPCTRFRIVYFMLHTHGAGAAKRRNLRT